MGTTIQGLGSVGFSYLGFRLPPNPNANILNYVEDMSGGLRYSCWVSVVL